MSIRKRPFWFIAFLLVVILNIAAMASEMDDDGLTQVFYGVKLDREWLLIWTTILNSLGVLIPIHIQYGNS